MEPPALADAPEQPIALFLESFNAARMAGIPLHDAAALATVDADGQPSVRMVLIKVADARGFTFFTSLVSRKGRQLAGNPRAALCFHWRRLARQIRVEGSVEPLTEAEIDDYFATRPRGSQLTAWATHQSEPMESRDELLARVGEYEAQFDGEDVPRPDQWGGFRIVPSRIEFWWGKPDRLHHRIEYTRPAPDAPWARRLLQP